MPSKNFVILIGGPGLFVDCDPKHDKTWLNYIAPIQQAADDDLYGKTPDETVHWFVFEPPYDNRWADDSVITAGESVEKFFSDAELHGVRKAAADKVSGTHAANYVGRIKQLAATKGIMYHGLRTKDDFWTELGKFPDGSISRVWYSGHASPEGLMLSLFHDSNCEPASLPSLMILTSDIPVKKASIQAKIDSSTSKSSNFYGCGTHDFAKEWHQAFGVPTAGAKKSITFNVRAHPGSSVLTLIETTATPQGSPEWTTFP